MTTYLRDITSGTPGVHTVRLHLTAQALPWDALTSQEPPA